MIKILSAASLLFAQNMEALDSKKFEERFLKEYHKVVPKDKGRISFTLYSTKGKKYLHEINADTVFRPASTLKAVTTAAAFEYLKPDYVFHTPVKLLGEKQNNIFKGKIEIEGTGDPSISTRFHGEGEFSELELLARHIKALGIDTLKGEIDLTHPNFEGVDFPKTWKEKFSKRCFGAKLSPWIFQENCIDIIVDLATEDSVVAHSEPYVHEVKVNADFKTKSKGRSNVNFIIDDKIDSVTLTGSVNTTKLPLRYNLPVRNPKEIFISALHRSLAKENIVWVKETAKKELKEYKTIRWTGRTLNEIVDVVNTRSHNLFSEMVLRQISYKEKGRGELSSSVKLVEAFLQKQKIDSKDWAILDGSGLSYGNRVVPRGLNKMLQNVLEKPYEEAYLKSLNYATELGASGSRMTEMLFPFGTRFKTGFVAETQGLVGYFFTAAGDTLVSTLYINDYKVHDHKIKKLMDRLWTKVADFYDAERESLIELQNLHAKLNDSMSTFEKLNLATSYFKDRPYLSPPTGEGYLGSVKQEPLMQTSYFDCVTFIEHPMSLLFTQSKDSIFNSLQSIRYKQGEVDFDHRNHFFIEDWVKNNSDKLIAYDSLADLKATRTTGRKKFYGFHKIDYKGKDAETELSYHGKKRISQIFDKPWGGENKILVVGLVGKLDWLWITHTGFLVLEYGKVPTFRHASTTEKKVVDMPFVKYLNGRTSILGAALYQIKKAP
jgi:PBP4 family serine-type D-alanyl-D-alanine carboxypeptidase